MLSPYIRQTIKPYACSIVSIKRFNEFNRIYEKQCISNLVQKIQYIHTLYKRQWISKVNQKMQCIRYMKHNEYPTLEQSITILSHS